MGTPLLVAGAADGGAPREALERERTVVRERRTGDGKRALSQMVFLNKHCCQ
jgi:hypothetical protein